MQQAEQPLLLISGNNLAGNGKDNSNKESCHFSENTHFQHKPQHEHQASTMMVHHQYPAATERYFFFDNTAPQTGKRAHPQFSAEPSWHYHAYGSTSPSSFNYENGSSFNHRAFASSSQSTMISEPAFKKARVVSDDEFEEPYTMNLARVKRALQQLEQQNDDGEPFGSQRITKRARMELPIQGPLPPEQETRIIVRDPSIPPRDIDTLEAERAIFNSLLLQRISNRYGTGPLTNLDLVDSKLQELIRGSMRKAITWTTDEDTTADSAIPSSPYIEDVTMEEDIIQDESSNDDGMMTF